MIKELVIEEHYYDRIGVELEVGDILEGDEYPFYEDELDIFNYYGLVMWDEADRAFVIRCTVAADSEVRGISDGNCMNLSEEADKNGRLWHFTKVGNVKDDADRLFREKGWIIEDCK